VPTYSYRCTECGTAFDIKQSFTDDALTECPTCGGVLRKVFSPVGVTFNGSGFYRTDSRSTAGSGNAGSGGSSAGGDSGSATPAKSESSSAPKTESGPAAAPKPSTGGSSAA
jgi:putative FmdB family regulatory protein